MDKVIQDKIKNSLKKRHRSEKIFKNSGLISIIISLIFLLILFTSIIGKGHGAFFQHKILIPIDLTNATSKSSNYRTIIKNSLKLNFPEATSRRDKFKLYALVSKAAPTELKKKIKSNPDILGQKEDVWLSASSNVDMYLKGYIKESTPSNERNLKDMQISWIKTLQQENRVKKSFSWEFFSNGDSREPEVAGMGASILGSFLTMTIFLLCAFPIGVMSAFYLEEFAPKNTITDIIEISINNLAAIPSIIFGLLGLVVYLNFMDLPRSSSIVGGLTLSLLVLPIIIIASRNSIKTIPSSIKDAAIALGASKTQVMFHHTLPLSLPGIMTGTILAMSRALGETAPLIMIGMVAFVVDTPGGFNDPTTVMPVQIYLWSDSPEIGFASKVSAAIMVLLTFLITFNGIAVCIRKKFERKW